MKFAKTRHSCLIAVLILLAVVALRRERRAPEVFAQGTIKMQSAEVVIDAVVTDRHNKLVAGLGPDDFIVYEDGVPQKLTAFQVSHGTALPSNKEENAKASKAVAVTAIPAAPGEFSDLPVYTILLLDYSTVEVTNQKYVQDAATNYVREKLQPNEKLAIFVLGSGLHALSGFTTDKDKLLAAVQTNDLRGTAVANERESLASEIGGAADSAATGGDATVSGATSGPGAASAGQGMGSSGPAAAAAMAATRIEAQYLSLLSALNREQTRQVLIALRAIALGVKQIPGRKNLLLVSQGFVIQDQLWGQLQSVVDTANKAQVAIYALDPRGLQTRGLTGSTTQRDEFTSALGISESDRNPLAGESRIKATGGENVFDRVSQVGHDQPETALRYISGSTGGFLIHNTNDLSEGLGRVSEEMRTYYQLSYHSANEKMDGKFRQIRVELRVPHLTVRSRAGYFAIPAGYDLLSPEEYQLVAKAKSVGTEERLPFYLRAGAFRQKGAEYTVPLLFEIPTTDLQFEQHGDSNEANLSIVGLVRNSNGEVLSRFGTPTKLQYTAAEYEALKTSYVSFMEVLTLPAGASYNFEVYLADETAHKVAEAQSALFLRQPGPNLGVSSLLLAHAAEKVQTNALDFLTFKGVRIRPSAHCQFHNGDNLLFYMDVYNPRLNQDQKTDLEVSIYVFKGATPVMKLPAYRLTQPITEQPNHVTVARYLKLAGLSPGNYSLIVSAKDLAGGGEEQSARAEFSVADQSALDITK